MAKTTSLSFPNMFDTSTGRVSVLEDNQSIVNRVKLLLLTDPTELYNNPTFGVGLRKYLFQYNNENTKKIIQAQIVDKLEEFEPCVNAQNTSFANGLLFTGETDSVQKYNKLEMTMGVSTTFGDDLSIELTVT